MVGGRTFLPHTAPAWLGDEMSESPTTSAKTPDVIQDPEPTLVEDRVSQAPVLVTEQEVVFSTAAAAVPLRPTTITRRLTDAIGLSAPPCTGPPRADTTRSAAGTSTVRAWRAKCTDSEYPLVRRSAVLLAFVAFGVHNLVA